MKNFIQTWGVLIGWILLLSGFIVFKIFKFSVVGITISLILQITALIVFLVVFPKINK